MFTKHFKLQALQVLQAHLLIRICNPNVIQAHVLIRICNPNVIGKGICNPC